MSQRYRVVYAPAALDDLDAVYSYIAFERSAAATARNLVRRIREEIRSLDVFPLRYARVDWEPWASAGIHQVSVSNFVIYYTVDSETMLVTVVRIFYGGRDVAHIVLSDDLGDAL